MNCTNSKRFCYLPCVSYFHSVSFCFVCQTFQLPAGLWGPAEPDFKMLQGECRKDPGVFRYRLSVHAVCGSRQEGTAKPLTSLSVIKGSL